MGTLLSGDGEPVASHHAAAFAKRLSEGSADANTARGARTADFRTLRNSPRLKPEVTASLRLEAGNADRHRRESGLPPHFVDDEPDDQTENNDSAETGEKSIALGENVRHPDVLQVITDSLRYWVSEMHVDGFRFDLASALARDSIRSTASPLSSTSSIRIRSSARSS